MADTQKKPTKTLALVTYGIAVLCLILGLVLPFGPLKVEGEKYNAVITQIPHALGCLGVKWDAGSALTYSYPVAFWGGKAFDLGGLFVLLYVLVCVVALGILVAVILGNKEKDTSLYCASVVEIISTVVLSVLLFMEMATISAVGYGLGYSWSISLVIAFGGPLLMLIIQSIAHKGGSGVIKTLTVILSGAAIVFCLFSFAAIIPELAKAMKDVLKDNVQLIDWTVEGVAPLGFAWYHLAIPFSANYGDFLKSLGGLGATVSVFMLLLGVVMIVNFLLDVCGLVKKTQRWMLLANLIRYGLEVLLVVLILIVGGAAGKHSIGIMCYVLLGLAVILTVINLIRFLTFKKEEAAEAEAEDAESAEDAEYDGQDNGEATAHQYSDKAERPAEEKATQSEHRQQPAAAPVASQDGNVYAPVIYNGPRDAFIDTLTNEQKIEFSQIFLEHRTVISGIPEYVLDGDNKTFFKSLFIYYARVRSLVSDGLMNKFYEQVKTTKN